MKRTIKSLVLAMAGFKLPMAQDEYAVVRQWGIGPISVAVFPKVVQLLTLMIHVANRANFEATAKELSLFLLESRISQAESLETKFGQSPKESIPSYLVSAELQSVGNIREGDNSFVTTPTLLSALIDLQLYFSTDPLENNNSRWLKW
jgi:hypothetical protein